MRTTLCLLPLASLHVFLCYRYLHEFRFINFLGGNGFTILQFTWNWLQNPRFFLEGNGFPPLPILGYALFLKIFNGDILLAFPATEVFVSTAALFFLFQISQELGFSPPLSFLITLAAILQFENVHLGSVTDYNDNFFYASALLGVWAWLRHRRTASLPWLYLSAAGFLLVTMSRWEGFLFSFLFIFLMSSSRLVRFPQDGIPNNLLHFWVPTLIANAYVIASAAYIYLASAGGPSLQGQKAGYAARFASGWLSPFLIFEQDLLWSSKSSLILGLCLIIMAHHLLSRQRRPDHILWSEYFAFPASVFFGYLLFTILRLGTPKFHLWTGFLLALPILFKPLQSKLFENTKYRLIAFGAVAYLLLFLKNQLQTHWNNAPHHLIYYPSSIVRAGFFIKSLWKNGRLQEDERILAELWAGGPVQEERGRTLLETLTIFKSPSHVLFDRPGLFRYKIKEDRFERIDAAPSLFDQSKGGLSRFLREEKIRVLLLQSPKRIQDLRSDFIPAARLDWLTFAVEKNSYPALRKTFETLR